MVPVVCVCVGGVVWKCLSARVVCCQQPDGCGGVPVPTSGLGASSQAPLQPSAPAGPARPHHTHLRCHSRARWAPRAGGQSPQCHQRRRSCASAAAGGGAAAASRPHRWLPLLRMAGVTMASCPPANRLLLLATARWSRQGAGMQLLLATGSHCCCRQHAHALLLMPARWPRPSPAAAVAAQQPGCCCCCHLPRARARHCQQLPALPWTCAWQPASCQMVTQCLRCCRWRPQQLLLVLHPPASAAPASRPCCRLSLPPSAAARSSYRRRQACRGRAACQAAATAEAAALPRQ
jgi:hypothetical protein